MSDAAIQNPFNLARYVLSKGMEHPEKVALSCVSNDGVESWTYGELIAAVRGTAAGLLDAGLQPGQIVLMRLGNTPDFPLAYLGAIAAGLVPVPTAAALTQAEVAKIIETLQPAAILRDAEVPCPPYDATFGLTELRAMRTLSPANWHMVDRERPAYIIYTSGTSGKPSAVVHAHRAILARKLMFDGWYGLTAQDRLLHAGAFNWTYTLGTGLMDPWTVGATALIPAPMTPAAELPDLLAKHDASIFAAAPGIYRQILKHHDALSLPDLRHGLSAGEKMSEKVRTKWQAATGRPVFEAFGMSECSTFISGSPAHPVAGDAVGRAQPGRRVAILDRNGAVRDGSEGTIAIHRDDAGLMLGYFNAPEQTAARYQGDWFLTGDQGVRAPNGDITYLGRNDDMMNAGGFRVSPLEVEAALANADGVTGIGVTQIEIKPDVFVIAAFYTSLAPLDDAALHRYAQTKLARYKQPRLYVHLEALPTGANGKLQRRALRHAYKGIAP